MCVASLKPRTNVKDICLSVYLHLITASNLEEESNTSPSGPAEAQNLPCPSHAVNLACPLSPASPRPQLPLPPLVERSWEMWLWPVGEKGPLCVPAKTRLLLNPNWAAFPNYLHYSSGLHFQMPSFNSEQKLLSGLIYNPDLLTGLYTVPPL